MLILLQLKLFYLFFLVKNMLKNFKMNCTYKLKEKKNRSLECCATFFLNFDVKLLVAICLSSMINLLSNLYRLCSPCQILAHKSIFNVISKSLISLLTLKLPTIKYLTHLNFNNFNLNQEIQLKFKLHNYHKYMQKTTKIH